MGVRPWRDFGVLIGDEAVAEGDFFSQELFNVLSHRFLGDNLGLVRVRGAVNAVHACFAFFGDHDATFGEGEGFQAGDDLEKLLELGGVVVRAAGEFDQAELELAFGHGDGVGGFGFG